MQAVIVTLSSAYSKRVCMRLALILLLPGPIASFVVSSQQRKLQSLLKTAKHQSTKPTATMSSNPSALYTPQDIKGWTALVTGASSGFGKATAWRSRRCINQIYRRDAT